jgi:tetratricopeptide (TPR) repeat protein
MISDAIRLGIAAAAAVLLAACSGQQVQLEIKARMDGQPVADATVLVDGKPLGATDSAGVLAKPIKSRAGAEVELLVKKELPGHRITPWKTTLLVKLGKDGKVIDRYSLEADLAVTRYFTVAVSEGGKPVTEASVKLSGKELGKTDAKGELIHDYTTLPPKGVALSVSKTGYAAWQKTASVQPGERVEIALARRAVLTVTAISDEYGVRAGVPGIAVSLDGRPLGKTDDRGVYLYTYDGAPGRKAQVALSAPGYLPAEWNTAVVLEGQVGVQRVFASATPRPIRVAVHRFAGNTPGVDLKEIASQAEAAMSAQLFKAAVFREVPAAELEAEVKRLKVGIERVASKGWKDTPLRRTVDMIVLGSVARDDKGVIVEAKFYVASGSVVWSQIARARDAGAINGAARDIVANVMERFPFEGTVVAVDGERYRLNLGKPYRIGRGTEFALLAQEAAKSDASETRRELGRLRVNRAEDGGSWAEIETVGKGRTVSSGDRVVRRMRSAGEDDDSGTSVTLSTKGGLAPDLAALAGVNIYLNGDWAGTTGGDGRAEVRLRLGKSYDIVLYRHGYQQVTDRLRMDKGQGLKEFILAVNNAVFKVDSEPSRATVLVDGDAFGKTPLLDGKPVSLGFHSVKLTVGEDYRDWEEVMEFDKKVEDRTGERRIVLHKDYLKLGERAAQQGDTGAAIQAYAATDKTHPDYSEAHVRLGQIYLDDKNDYEAAVREFESVLTLPQNKDLIYKQFAVAFTNLGHAYYEKGSRLVDRDREAAAQALAKAVQNLQVAKQNTRFFPTAHHDEALHDTYYYLALAYHKLYQVTRKGSLQAAADLAWREYFDFFPKRLEGNPTFEQSRAGARKYWDQIKDQS